MSKPLVPGNSMSSSMQSGIGSLLSSPTISSRVAAWRCLKPAFMMMFCAKRAWISSSSMISTVISVQDFPSAVSGPAPSPESCMNEPVLVRMSWPSVATSEICFFCASESCGESGAWLKCSVKSRLCPSSVPREEISPCPTRRSSTRKSSASGMRMARFFTRSKWVSPDTRASTRTRSGGICPA